MANVEHGSLEIPLIDRLMLPGVIEKLVGDDRIPQLSTVTMKGAYSPPKTFNIISILPLGWRNAEKISYLIGTLADFYGPDAQYIGRSQEAEITSAQMIEIKRRIQTGLHGKMINQISAENRANPPELFG